MRRNSAKYLYFNCDRAKWWSIPFPIYTQILTWRKFFEWIFIKNYLWKSWTEIWKNWKLKFFLHLLCQILHPTSRTTLQIVCVMLWKGELSIFVSILAAVKLCKSFYMSITWFAQLLVWKAGGDTIVSNTLYILRSML